MTHAPPNAESDFGRGDKSCCDRMNVKRLIFTPGDSLARRFDEGYTKFMARMRRKMKNGNRRLAIYSLLARAECGLAFVVGASASYFGFVIVVSLVLCLYPLIALGDPFLWRRTYGRLVRGIDPSLPHVRLSARSSTPPMPFAAPLSASAGAAGWITSPKSLRSRETAPADCASISGVKAIPP